MSVTHHRSGGTSKELEIFSITRIQYNFKSIHFLHFAFCLMFCFVGNS